MALLEVSHLQKIYKTRFGGSQVEALHDVNFAVEEGEYVAIMGESGSGKTTLLNILAALDVPTSGQVVLNGRNFEDISEKRERFSAGSTWALCSRILISLIRFPCVTISFCRWSWRGKIIR